MATDVKARFATGGTATSATTLAAEQDVDDGSDLTLTGAAATFAPVLPDEMSLNTNTEEATPFP